MAKTMVPSVHIISEYVLGGRLAKVPPVHSL